MVILSSGIAKPVRMEAWSCRGPSLLPCKEDLSGDVVNTEDSRAKRWRGIGSPSLIHSSANLYNKPLVPLEMETHGEEWG